MDNNYWENYYNTHRKPERPSRFAEFVLENHLEKQERLLELGCGNGRDSIYFAHGGILVSAVDQVGQEIDFLNAKYASDRLRFKQGDFTKLKTDDLFDGIYSRFTMHSIREKEEVAVLRWCVDHLTDNGRLFVEVRSINDEKLQQGERLSDNENIVDGHYRRYIRIKQFKKRLEEVGLRIIYAEEKTGFAPYGDEDPPVIRVVAGK